MPIEVQGLIGMDNDLETLKESSERVKELLEENRLFKR